MVACGGGISGQSTGVGHESTPTSGPSQITFHSDRSGDNEIYTIDPDGSNLTRLTTDPGSDMNPAWSPDGSKIAFQSSRSGNNEIYIMDADGSNQRRLSTQASQTSTLMVFGDIVAGGESPPGAGWGFRSNGFIGWDGCPGYDTEGRFSDDGSENCKPHVHLINF